MYNICVADVDEGYIKILKEHLEAHYLYTEKASIKVRCITSGLELRELLRMDQMERFDLIILGERMADMMEDIVKENQESKLVVLKEVEYCDESRYENSIFKYQAVSNIISEIQKILQEKTQGYTRENKEAVKHPADKEYYRRAVKVAVFSPVGGVGCTSMALGLSIQTALAGMETFYLNWENISSTLTFLPKTNTDNISHILFHLKSNKAGLNKSILQAVRREPHYNISYFAPADSAFDINDDFSAEIPFLLDEIISAGNYERLFIDLDHNLNFNTLAILMACDLLIFVSNQHPIAVTKYNMFLNSIRVLNREEAERILQKSFLVINKFEQTDVNQELLSMGRRKFYIPYVEDLYIIRDEKIRLDMNSSFGSVINEIVKLV